MRALNRPNSQPQQPQPAPLTPLSRARGCPDGAAGFTTCGKRAGSLYHERQDARWWKSQGVDYLKYDDCGEANIQ